MKKYSILVLISVLLITNFVSASDKVYKFGIVPQQAATKLIETWKPMIDYLKSKCNCEIEFATAVDITTFEENIKKGEYDFVYLNPFHYVVSGEPNGYTAIAVEKDRKLKGLVVVPKESAIKSIQDLKNAKIAFPGPTAFAASILVRQLFESENIATEPVYVKSHESVYTGVISGLFQAGGAINRTFDALPEDQKNQLRILATTVEVTPHPIAIHKRVENKIIKKIELALLDLNESEDGKKMLTAMEFKGLKKPTENSWDEVRKITKKMEQAPASKK